MGIELRPSTVCHPGPWIRQTYLAQYDISATKLAAHLGVSRQALAAVLNGRSAVSVMMALRLEKAFGIRAEALLAMQIGYDLAQIRLSGKEPDVERLEVV